MGERRDPVRIGSVLGENSAELGIEDARIAARVLRAWKDIVGADVAAHAQPSSVRDRTLRVRTESPLWATELGYMADDLKARVNEHLGAALIGSVVVWVGQGESPRMSREGRGGTRPVAADPGIDLTEIDPATALARARSAWAQRRVRGAVSRGSENHQKPR